MLISVKNIYGPYIEIGNHVNYFGRIPIKGNSVYVWKFLSKGEDWTNSICWRDRISFPSKEKAMENLDLELIEDGHKIVSWEEYNKLLLLI